MADEKKKVSVYFIIAVIIIIILLLLLFLFFKGKRSIEAEFNDTMYNYAGQFVPPTLPSTPESPKKEYRTSDKLSEITFSRIIDYTEGESPDIDTWKANVNIKLTGYVQEIDPTTARINMVYNQAYVFKNNNVAWDISGSQTRESRNCKFVYAIDSSGSKPIEQLNVDTGDVKMTLVPVEGWGSWKLAYSEMGFYTGTPEISLEGEVIMPAVRTITTTLLDEHSICGDYATKGPVETYNMVLHPMFPFRLNKVDLNVTSYTGNFEIEDDAFDSPEGATATMENAQLYLPLDLREEMANWTVSYKIYMP
jgi:hypothetical protein